MDLIAIWRHENYVRDLEWGAGFHFNSKQRRLHSEIEIGESLWLVTRIVVRGQNEYRLPARLQGAAKTINAPEYPYGPFRIWGKVANSSYYEVRPEPRDDVFELIRLLPMHGFSLQDATRSDLFQRLQTIRGVKPEGARLLNSFAQQLPPEPRAKAVVDEQRLERAFGEDEARLAAVLQEHAGVSDSTKERLRSSFYRSRDLTARLNKLYGARCQVTGFDSPLIYGVRTTEAHHVVYLSRGGADELTNLILLSPNTHKVVHAADAKFDYRTLSFVFPNGRVEPLVLNKHILPSAA